MVSNTSPYKNNKKGNNILDLNEEVFENVKYISIKRAEIYKTKDKLELQ